MKFLFTKMTFLGDSFVVPANLEASRVSSKISAVKAKTLLGQNHLKTIKMGLRNLSKYNPMYGRLISRGPMTLRKRLFITTRNLDTH